MHYKDTGPVQLAYLNLQKKLRRAFKKLHRPRWMQALQQQNLTSGKPIIQESGPVVSLTSYGARLETVFYTIESIAAGKCLPSALNLYIGEADYKAGIPESLLRLTERGLRIHAGQDFGPHTKYYPQVKSEVADQGLVTADDDVLYPKNWLLDLNTEHTAAPDLIKCYRAHVISLGDEGFHPYWDWPSCASTLASHLHFFTGVGGVLYPAQMQLALREAGDEFLKVCPKADDIWLNVVALRSGIKARQIVPIAARYYEIPGTRLQGLANYNNGQQGNDTQIRATYRASDIEALRACSR